MIFRNFFFLLFIVTNAFAETLPAGDSSITIDFSGKSQVLLQDKENNFYISKFCFKDHDCEAWRVLKEAKVSTAKLHLAGGANPAAVLCGRYKGVIHANADANGNETSYCVFKDESVVTASAIWHFALLNDKVLSPKDAKP